ncbi:porin [Vibrio fluvialis]|nr:porin [Vibrio fluvialis]
MKKLLMCAVILASPVSAAPHLQGYYQAKELVGYTVNKIQQNKAEYFMLDYALKLAAQPEAQLVPYNNALGHFQSLNSGVDEAQFKRIMQKVNPSGLQDQYVCRVDVSGVKLAYTVKEGEGCSSSYGNKPMAISQKGSKVTFFRRWDFDPTQVHFDIQSYENGTDTETLTLDYVMQFEGRWIGSSVQVVKGKTQLTGGGETPTYDVAQYQYSGARTGIFTGGETLLYSEQPYFITDNVTDTATNGAVKHVAETVFNTFGLMDGEYGGRYLKSNGPVYWITRDYVKQYEYETGQKAYFVSDPQGFVIETSMSGTADSWVYMDKTPEAAGGEWVAHAFNNTHNLTSFSPTFCMINDIANGQPVTAYYTADGTGSWNPSMDDCKSSEPLDRGLVAKVYTKFINSYGETIDVTSLQQSAKDILYVRDQHPQGSKELLTLEDVKAMQHSARYTQLKAKLSKHLGRSGPHFWP